MEITDRTQMLDALWEAQDTYGCIRDEDIADIAQQLNISKIDVEGVVSFYHFFSRQFRGKYTIYLNNSIMAEFSGYARIKQALEQETGAKMGSVDPSGTFGLYETACIGLSDQEPSALINFQPFIKLTPQKIHQIIFNLKLGLDIDSLADVPATNVQWIPEDSKAMFFRPYKMGNSINKLRKSTSRDVISELKKSKLHGMGGAFFPTYIKWDSCRKEIEPVKYIVCNADEGEPGTFKDRVLIQTIPGILLEGMIIAGFVAGAKEGFIYLRAEYRYLVKKLKELIKSFHQHGLLGKDILGIDGFHFNITVRIGAGAYVCGEETALLESMEGKRGEPRPKLFFPTQRGYLNKPTIINNVETFCAAARIMEIGAAKICEVGTDGSPGNKILSVSGDCQRPGVYEIHWGITLNELLELVGAENPRAIQLSGPAGELISMEYSERKISVEDLLSREYIRCGGSIMIYNQERDLIRILKNYNKFFRTESCGICTPCRGGNFILSKVLDKLEKGNADQTDLEQLNHWTTMMRFSSRCGLGKTATNSITQAIERFPGYFNMMINEDEGGLIKHFNVEKATEEYDKLTQLG